LLEEASFVETGETRKEGAEGEEVEVPITQFD